MRMNANAYGSRARAGVGVGRCLQRRRHDPPGARRARLRLSPLRAAPGRSDPLAAFALRPLPSDEVKRTLGEMRSKRRAAQPSGIKTFGSTFKNPADPRAEGRTAGQLLEAAGCRGLRVGGAGFSAKHANFVENLGDATTADVVALMDEGRRQGQGAVRRRAGARGPDPRAGRVPGRLEPDHERRAVGVGAPVPAPASAPARPGRARPGRGRGPAGAGRGRLAVAAQLIAGGGAAGHRGRRERPQRRPDSPGADHGGPQHDHAQRQVVALRTAVEPFPVVKQLHVVTDFPHRMRIAVTEQVPVATISAAGQQVAVSADGTLLHGSTIPGSLPTIPLAVSPRAART